MWWVVLVPLLLAPLLWWRRRPKERPWEASQKKGSNSYYFAHHRANDGLKASDYRMNGPRRLSTDVKAPTEQTEGINKYALEDKGDRVVIYVDPQGWDTSYDVQVQHTSTQLTVTLVGVKRYALTVTLKNITSVKTKLTKKRLTIFVQC